MVRVGPLAEVIQSAYYGIDKQKELEIDLYMQYGRDAIMLHVDLMDLNYEHNAQDLDAALSFAAWKDDYLNPVTQGMLNLMSTIKDKSAQSVELSQVDDEESEEGESYSLPSEELVDESQDDEGNREDEDENSIRIDLTLTVDQTTAHRSE